MHYCCTFASTIGPTAAATTANHLIYAATAGRLTGPSASDAAADFADQLWRGPHHPNGAIPGAESVPQRCRVAAVSASESSGYETGAGAEAPAYASATAVTNAATAATRSSACTSQCPTGKVEEN